MFCYKCGASVPDDSGFCNKCGAKISDPKTDSGTESNQALQMKPIINNAGSAVNEQKQKRGCLDYVKLILSAIGVFLVVCLILGIVSNSIEKKNNTGKTTNNTPTIAVSNNTENKSITKAVQEEKKVTETSSAEKSNRYMVGDVVEKNGLKITFVSTGKYIEPNVYLQPSAGNMYWKFELIIENTSKTDKMIYSFNCYADNSNASETYVGDDRGLYCTLSPGRKVEGSAYFEVPKNAGSIEMEYEIDSWSGEKVIFVGK